MADHESIHQDSHERVAQLVRTLTEQSTTEEHSDGDIVNPFEVSADPAMDPNSEKFNATRWARALLTAVSQDPERYPQRTAGVSYRNLGVHGIGKPTDYQKSVANVLLYGPNTIWDRFHQNQSKVQILQDFEGLVRSGEMLVVLGRPGSGVTTLLKTIAGQTRGLYVDSASEFNYQGISRKMMHKDFRGQVIYQAETDVHFPQLTVGQTLMFAALAKTPNNRVMGVSRQRYAEHIRDVVMAVFGLSHTVNTKLGNDFIRGVSGGERKRVSIAEVTLSRSPLQCWDNSTRGLDSATALQFVKTLRLSTDIAKTAAILAIYQASQNAYDHFDKVAVLYKGRQIFFGYRDDAKTYFTDMGYHCPDRQTTADFLTSLTSPEERIVKRGFENLVPRTPDEFATVWKNSPQRAQLLRDISAFEKEYPIAGPELEVFKTSKRAEQSSWTRAKSPYTISVPLQAYLCISRGIQRLRGDMSFFLITVFGNFVIALVLGSVFYNLSDTTASFFGRGTLLFFAILFNALSSALEILTLFSQRPIVEKHSTYALYHPFAEAISSMICELPSKVISTFAFNVPLYLMANLRREADAFFIFLFFSFTCTLTMSSMFRFIGQSSRTISQAMVPGALFILALVIYTGYIIPTRNMQGWLRWLNYLNPIAYAFEALMANEFHNREFPCARFVPEGPPYVNATGLEKTCAGALPGQDFVDGDFYVGANFGYYHSHIWRNFGILVIFMIVLMALYLFVAETISASHSKGEVLIFRRSRKDLLSKEPKKDEETANGTIIHTSDDLAGNTAPLRQETETTIQKQTAIYHWTDVSYEIQIKGEKRMILNQVDGWVKPGTLTALMGATGAGKTTLLDVLANRVTMGVVTGDMMVNGSHRASSFQKNTGYVQQQDLHLQTSTVREALRFSALLRQPYTVPKDEKLSYVDEVIRLLEMEDYADAVVGVPGEGLNVEQRKRLTIGVELAAKPDLLLFLDEPTSGLDSQTSWSICSLIRKLADNGQAILCTIHQPSAVLFQRFDRLLLLAKGGKTVYFGDVGENSNTLISYFEKNGGRKCEPEENPAEWMLEVIGAAPGSHVEQDWFQTWRGSPEFASVKDDLKKLEQDLAAIPKAAETAASNKQFSSPFFYQLVLVLYRVFTQYWRTPSYIYAKLSLCFMSSLFIGLSFANSEVSLQGLQNQMFSIFMLMIIFGFLAYQIMPNFILQRELYEARERPSKTYSWQAFIVANIFAELPWNALCGLLIFFPVYYLIGMYKNAIPTGAVAERGGLFFLLTLAFMLYTSTFTSMIVAGAQTAEIGAIIVMMMFALSLIFCGVLATPTVLPRFWIFMYRVSPFTYLVSAFLSTGLANNAVQCSSLELSVFNPPSGQTCGAYMAAYIQYASGAVYNPTATANCEFCPIANTSVFLASVFSFYDQRWRNLAIMVAYIIFDVFMAVLLYWLIRVPKRGKDKKM